MNKEHETKVIEAGLGISRNSNLSLAKLRGIMARLRKLKPEALDVFVGQVSSKSIAIPDDTDGYGTNYALMLHTFIDRISELDCAKINMPEDKKFFSCKAAGWCFCTYEPRGDNGLEGYAIGDRYYYQKMWSEHAGNYYRVYPTGGTYYETCGTTVFKRFFQSFYQVDFNE